LSFFTYLAVSKAFQFKRGKLSLKTQRQINKKKAPLRDFCKKKLILGKKTQHKEGSLMSTKYKYSLNLDFEWIPVKNAIQNRLGSRLHTQKVFEAGLDSLYPNWREILSKPDKNQMSLFSSQK
jgi:hypothetical protein